MADVRQAAQLPSGQRDDPDARYSVADLENRHGRLDVETSRSGGAGIHDQATIGGRDKRNVRVAIDDDVGCITSEELYRLRRSEFVAVAHVDFQAADFDVNRRREPGIPGVVGVAEDCLDGRDDRELVKDLVTPDVAGVEDTIDPGQCDMNLRPHEAMSVGNQTEPMDGGCGRWDV